MSPRLVSADLDVRGAGTHSGFVDSIDGRLGVHGWAVNLAELDEPVRLHLYVGDQFVAETVSDGHRDDISAKLGRDVRTAFSFAPSIMVSLSSYMEDPEDEVTVRVASTGQFLPSAGAITTVNDILFQLRADTATATAPGIADFELLLDELRAGAVRLADQALRPIPENLQGYIETLAVDGSGQVWFMGWIKRGHLQEFSAVLVERRKVPAAIAVMSYTRDDLPQDACGIVGLIASNWRPSSATADLHVFFGAGGRFHLRSNPPLRLITAAEFAVEYEGIRDRCVGDGRAIILQRLLTALDSWLPAKSTGQSFATETSIDRILLVPGLGALVEGWVMSPMKRVEGLRLRVGACVMSSVPDSLFWKPRPDLLESFPGSERMVERAGFVGLFTGDAEPEDFTDPMLKIVFQGGASANWPLPTNVFRRLGHSANIDDALRFFPALQEEIFFPRLAEAAIRAERAAMNPPVKLSLARAKRVMVFVLPQDRCDLFLLFEEVAAQCREAGGLEALAFIATSHANRADALWMFRDFQATYGEKYKIACSLLVIDSAEQAFALLPAILADLGASRFVFAAAGVFLTQTGWVRARQALAARGTDLVFLGIEAESFERHYDNDDVSARCFAWSTGHFMRWAMTMPNFMGGYFRENGLSQAKAAHVIHHNAARAIRTVRPTRVQEAVNQAVYARASQSGGAEHSVTGLHRAAAPARHGQPSDTLISRGLR